MHTKPVQKQPGRTIDSPHQAVLNLAIPATVSQISMVVVQTVDTMFIGRLGPLAIGALGLITTLTWNIIALGEGFAVGLSSCMARRFGAEERADAMDYFRTGILAILLAGSLITPLLLLTMPQIFSLIQLPPELYEHASDYYRYFCTFFPVIYFRIALEAGFRAAGDTKTTMKAGILTNVVNIGLDWLLIFGHLGFPRLGVAGAALASGLSIIAGTLYLLAEAQRSGLNPLGRSCRFIGEHLRRIVRVAVPAAAERVAMSASQLLVMVVAVNPLGGVMVGAFQIVLRLASFSFMPGYGFSMAAATLVGQQLGAQRPDRARQYGWRSTAYCGMIMLAISLLYFLFPAQLGGLFTDDPVVTAAIAAPLRIYAVFGIFLAPTMVLTGSLHGAGDTRFTMIIMMLSRFGIRLPVAWFLSIALGLGLTGAWIAMSLDFILRGILLILRFRGGRWQLLQP